VSSQRSLYLSVIISFIYGGSYNGVTRAITATTKSSPLTLPLSASSLLAKRLRGGESSTTTTANKSDPTHVTKKKKRKSRSKSKLNSGRKTKNAINNAMKEKDSAEALGDAIRERAGTLLQDKIERDPLLKSIDESVASVGTAMGASDYDENMYDSGSSGGVQASPTAVVVNYFLKSHGGAHLLQSASSLLATACAVATLFMTSKYSSNPNPNVNNAKWTLVLLRRTLIFAMIKHVSGLLASASMAAKAIPKIGIAQSRQWMEDIVREPVAQYVFYTALLLLWLPRGDPGSILAIWWWPRQRWIIPWFIGPILLREIVSNILIISDILVLWTFGCGEKQSGAIEQILKVSRSVINLIMSLLVSPTRWRPANSAERQTILAVLVSKISLFLEAGVGAIIMVDLFVVLFHLVIGGVTGLRPSWHEVFTKIIVIRLFVHYFVYLRWKKLSRLAKEIRGGAVQLPFFFLDSLYEPAKAVGISINESKNNTGKEEFSSWRDYLSTGLGLESEEIRSK